jgi:hypothetical protein
MSRALDRGQQPIAAGALGNGSQLTDLNATELKSGTVPTARLGSGTANNTTFLRGDNTWAAVGGGTDIQTFNSNGTWTKPSTGSMARIEVWGGGGGAGRSSNNTLTSGGGGGGYNEITVPLSTLASTVSVTVGAGGAGRTGSTGNGNQGGTSSFGTLLSAFGGGGGFGNTTGIALRTSGGGGGQLSAGSLGLNSASINSKLTGRPFAAGVAGLVNAMWHGGTGFSRDDDSYFVSGDSVFGGGAGGFASIGRGQSVYGGDGGDRFSIIPSEGAGAAPGGGGGTSLNNNIDGGSGAAGRVIVTVW